MVKIAFEIYGTFSQHFYHNIDDILSTGIQETRFGMDPLERIILDLGQESFSKLSFSISTVCLNKC